MQNFNHAAFCIPRIRHLFKTAEPWPRSLDAHPKIMQNSPEFHGVHPGLSLCSLGIWGCFPVFFFSVLQKCFGDAQKMYRSRSRHGDSPQWLHSQKVHKVTVRGHDHFHCPHIWKPVIISLSSHSYTIEISLIIPFISHCADMKI